MSQVSGHAIRDASLEAHLLGVVDFDDCLALQQRLVYESSGRVDGQVTLLICEHSPTITIGRQGSRSHIRLPRRELISRRLKLRWVNRGGGCLLHVPGQLAIYPIVPLEWHRLSVGEYLKLFERALADALADVRFVGELRGRQQGIWGRHGQVMAIGTAVKNWTTYFGAYLNVAPAMELFRWIESDLESHAPMSSLAVEARRAPRMSGIREALVTHLSSALGCSRCHVYAGHALFKSSRGSMDAAVARVG